GGEGEECRGRVEGGGREWEGVDEEGGAADDRRMRLQVLQPEKLTRLEILRGGRRAHDDFDDRRRQTIDFDDPGGQPILDLGPKRLPFRVRRGGPVPRFSQKDGRDRTVAVSRRR